jgi:hypothetical protein
MDCHTGKLPAALALDAQEIARQAAVLPFVEFGLTEAALADQVNMACSSGSVFDRALAYRIVARRNGKLNGQGDQWLARLAGGSCQT